VCRVTMGHAVADDGLNEVWPCLMTPSESMKIERRQHRKTRRVGIAFQGR
jgi:hypothetical protein